MIEEDLRKVAEVFADISSEVILKRRQNLFISLYNLDNKFKAFLSNTVALSLALNTDFDISPKATINNAPEPFSEALGKVIYFVLEGDIKKTRRELHKLPSYLQIIISFIVSKKLVKQLTHEYLFNILDSLEPYSKLLTTFVKLPESEPEVNLEKVVSFSRNSEVATPFYIMKRTKLHTNQGKLYYLTNNGGTISSNITNKMVKQYFSKYSRLTKYGVIISMVFNRKKSRVKHVQVLYFTRDISTLKGIYTGKSSELSKPSVDFWANFRTPLPTIDVSFKTPNYVTDIDVGDIKLYKGGNIILHSGGISTISDKSYTVKAKVVDYLIDEDTYEPLGFRVKTDTGIYDVKCNIVEDTLDRGINDLYINVKQTEFMGKVAKTEFSSILSNRYRTCALCGETKRLLTEHLCFECNATLYKVAVSSNMKMFEFDKIPPAISGVTMKIYKFDVVFSEVSVGFSENLGLVKGKQLRLPYNWWDRGEWLNI